MNSTAVAEGHHHHHDSHSDFYHYTNREVDMNQKDFLNAITHPRRRPFNFIATDRYLEEDGSEEGEGGPYLSGDEEDD